MGYFDKIKRSDVFVFFDGATYSRNGFHNRNRIKTSQGWVYLTIPVSRKEQFKPMKDVAMPLDTSWAKKHLRAIEMNYSKTPFWKDHKDFFEKYYTEDVKNLKTLAQFNLAFIKYVCEYLEIKARLVLESEMNIDHELKSTEWLLVVCKELDATKYLSGPSGSKYLKTELFDEAKIEIEYQHYDHPTYSQLYGDFEKGLAIIDLICNVGPEAKDLL